MTSGSSPEPQARLCGLETKDDFEKAVGPILTNLCAKMGVGLRL